MTSVLDRLPIGTISGRHPRVGEYALGNIAVLQELGSDGHLKSNIATIEYVANDPILAPMPKAVSSSMVKPLTERGLGDTIVLPFVGPSAKGTRENTGTFGEFEQYRDFRLLHPQYDKPVLVTSGYNVGNILRQAKILEIDDCIVPPDLPRAFDWQSDQLWTKNWALWVLLAKVRINRLKQEGH